MCFLQLVKLATHSASYGKPEQLAHDLRIYSFGLFPLLQYASMAVKVRWVKYLMLIVYLNYFNSPRRLNYTMITIYDLDSDCGHASKG